MKEWIYMLLDRVAFLSVRVEKDKKDIKRLTKIIKRLEKHK